mgnify:FL=1
MANLRDIKGKIRAVGKTRQVTRAMEAVSAAKMRRSQEKAIVARPYAVSAFHILRSLSQSIDKNQISLMQERAFTKPLIVLVTSDRGLAGSLNSAVLKKVNQFIASKNLARAEVGFVTIGKKGYEHYSKRGYTIVQHAEKFVDAPEIFVVEEIAKQVFELFESGAYSHVYVVYSNFISTFAQEPHFHQVLPLSFEGVDAMIKGITPTKGKYAELFKEENGENNHSIIYTYEPSIEEVLRGTILSLTTATIYHAVLEAKASEYSARMVAMRSASDKALEMGSALTLKYNKARQSAITREVSEIIGGIEALAK